MKQEGMKADTTIVGEVLERENYTERPESSEGTEADRSGEGLPAVLTAVSSLDQAVALALPSGKHQSHKCLFTLARAVKTFEQGRGTTISQSELKGVFDGWHRKAKRFLRRKRSRDEYWFEFLEAYENASVPLGKDVVSLAWEAATTNPPPPEALQFESLDLRLLVGLCFELQKRCGSKPFFLASRTVQRLFGHATHATAAFWLAGLRRSGVLKVVEQGGPKSNRASRYVFSACARRI
jgi:hypothetical protein